MLNDNNIDIIYIGDSHNDICPCLHLRKNDTVLARENLSLHKYFVLFLKVYILDST